MYSKFCYLLGVILTLLFSSWGFYAHKRIHYLAVFTLPPDMVGFYKRNILYVSEHAVDADKRRYADTAEAARHYLDADRYGNSPFDSIPQRWEDAAARFTEDTLKAHGILPWQIARSYNRLVRAFAEKDSLNILRASVDLGHYIADAHVPLHTTKNYNGQLSGQHGIHGFWESRLPELYAGGYDFFTGRAQYIEHPLKEAWSIVKNSYSYKDSVLLIEASLSVAYPSDRKYDFSQRNGIVVRQYSQDFSDAYHTRLKGMVERQMRASVRAVGSFWYSAWIDAGQPALKNLRRNPLTERERKQHELEEALFNQGKTLGREEVH